MNRRKFMTLFSGAATTWRLAAHAQRSERMRRVGVLMHTAATQPEGQSNLADFVQGLRQLGWNEGQNLRIEVRWNAGDAQLAKIFAAQLIGLMPDVILAASSTNLEVLRQVTSTIPIVFVMVTDPVEQGFVSGLAHPGGNITGFSNYESSIGGKWLELLKDVAPNLTRVAAIVNPDTSPQFKFYMQAIEAAALSLGVKASALPVRSPVEIKSAVEGFAVEPNGGLILPANTFTNQHASLIIGLTARHRFPSIGLSSGFVRNGGLLSYTVNPTDDFRRDAAGYVDRILKGEKPGDLPVQFPTKFDLAINLKTAKALGLTVPPSIMLRATEVIE
jgi:putative ABC transport system substrate-binding protein